MYVIHPIIYYIIHVCNTPKSLYYIIHVCNTPNHSGLYTILYMYVIHPIIPDYNYTILYMYVIHPIIQDYILYYTCM